MLPPWLAALPLALAGQDSTPPSREVGEHTQSITQLVASDDGRFLYTATRQGEVQAFDLKKDELVWSVELGHPLLAMDLGDEWIVFTFGPPTVTPLSVETGETKQGVGGPNLNEQTTCIVGDSKDRWAWLGSKEGTLVRLNPDNVNGWSRRSMKNGGVRSLARDGKEKLLAVGGEDGTIRFLNPKSASRDEKKVFEGHEAPVTALAFDAKGSALYSGDEKGVLRVWKVSNGKSLHALEGHGAAIATLASDPKGRWFASGDVDGRIVVWEAKAAEKRIELDGEGGVAGLVFLGKSGQLAAPTGHRVTIWDLSDL
jgi:WD40 repeat protein